MPTGPGSSGADVTAPPGQHDQLHEQWCEAVEQITTHVFNLFHNRAIWREMSEGLRQHEGGVFLDHYADLYVAGQVMAVRRLADHQADGPTFSLGRLLGDLERNPAVMNRDRFVLMHTTGEDDDAGFWTTQAQKVFDERFGDSHGELSLLKNRDRQDRLTAASQAISDFADRFVAHLDSRKLEELPTFEDLDMAIDAVGQVLKEVTLLLTAATLVDTEPTIQEDWKRPFREALF